MKLFLDAIQFLYNLMQPLPRIENIYHIHFLDLLLRFFIQSGESIYEPSRLKFILWHL